MLLIPACTYDAPAVYTAWAEHHWGSREKGSSSGQRGQQAEEQWGGHEKGPNYVQVSAWGPGGLLTLLLGEMEGTAGLA